MNEKTKVSKKASKKKAVKRVTLHQRMRADAERKLNAMIEQASEVVGDVVVNNGATISGADLMAVAGGNQVQSLRKHLVNQLTRDAEAELESHYNSQHSLPLEDATAS